MLSSQEMLSGFFLRIFIGKDSIALEVERFYFDLFSFENEANANIHFKFQLTVNKHKKSF